MAARQSGLPTIARRAAPMHIRNARRGRAQGRTQTDMHQDMHPDTRDNRKKLADRVVKAAEAALAAQKYVSPVDVMLGIGWVAPSSERRWRQGQVDCLEGLVQANPARISEGMGLLREWATAKGLIPSETAYVARTPSRPTLRFSASADPGIEQLYRTHWLSPEL